MAAEKSKIDWQDLGRVPYAEAFALQERLRDLRLAGDIGDRLMLLEHDPVITMGRRDCESDLVSTPAALKSAGIELVKTNRGGRATYHGPGQLVGYFICELAGLGLGVRDFVRAVEEILIRALRRFDVVASRDDSYPGLWIGCEKIAAIGLNIQRGVTEHGFALNVGCDLEAYSHLVACGISDRGVTGISRQRGSKAQMSDVILAVVEEAGRVLGRDMLELGPT